MIVMIQKKYSEKRCQWCNNTFIPKAPHQLYCDTECSRNAKRKYGNDRVRKYRKKYKHIITQEIGTGNLYEHRHPNVEVEYKKIVAEFRRLHLQHK